MNDSLPCGPLTLGSRRFLTFLRLELRQRWCRGSEGLQVQVGRAQVGRAQGNAPSDCDRCAGVGEVHLILTACREGSVSTWAPGPQTC